MYEDIFDAKNACDHLSGFNVCNRYLVVLYYQSTKVSRKKYVFYTGMQNEPDCDPVLMCNRRVLGHSMFNNDSDIFFLCF